MIRNLRLALLVLTPLLAASCNSTPKEPSGRWIEEQVQAPSDRVIWQVALLSLSKMRFPLAGGLNPSEGLIKTGWKTNMQPFQGDGYREKAEVEISAVEAGMWKVRARVKRQRNEALVAPLDPTRAEWEWSSDNSNAARILVMHMRSLLPDDLSFKKQDEEGRGETLERYVRELEERKKP